MTRPPRIVVNCIVQNEERWVWYALRSVIDFVDEILVFDTGSTDRTCEMVEAVGSGKIRLERKGTVPDRHAYTRLRQEMLDRSDCDWLLTLDGDEVYFRETMQGYRDLVERPPRPFDAVVVKFYNLLGDVFHHEKEEHGGYAYFGETRSWTTRLVRRSIPGLHFPPHKGYGEEGLADGTGRNLQDRGDDTLILLDRYFLHMTFLQRSSDRMRDREVPQRRAKFRAEYGIPFPPGFRHPEVFHTPRPAGVPSPWQRPPLAVRAWMLARQKGRSLRWVLSGRGRV